MYGSDSEFDPLWHRHEDLDAVDDRIIWLLGDLAEYRRNRDENAGRRLNMRENMPQREHQLVRNPIAPEAQQLDNRQDSVPEKNERRQHGWRIRKKIILARFGALDEYDENKMTCQDIADKYRVNVNTVSNVW